MWRPEGFEVQSKSLERPFHSLPDPQVERNPDLREMREERDRKERAAKREEERKKQELEKEEAKKREELNKLKSYDSLMKSENMTSNMDCGYDSDDFM